ncbi:MAG: choice-of-anchor D domain-containing protein, partial [Bacteroidetes bacterium]|nr:choice-of-anchor D domain-containing protein [Bacteroidota bacterium]
IELNTVRSKPLSVENRGSDTLKITQISVNSNVFSVNRSAFEIPPGRSETVQIQARPVSSGSRSGSVTITSNAVNAATYVIPTSLVGYNSAFGPVNETGLPYAVVFERALVDSTRLQAGEEIALFDGDNLVGKSVATGNWPLEVIAWQKTDAGQNGFLEGNPITVRTQASRYGATVTRNLDSLVVVRGDGTFGNGPFTVLKAYGKSGRAPLARFNRTELGFPDTKVNRSSELTIVVENEGGTTLTGSLTVGQPYVITTSNNLSISPGGTAEVGLQFQPTVPGNYPASLSISTNDPFNPVSQISLNGRAIIDLGDDPVRFTGPATPVYPVPLDESQRITVNIYNPFNDPASGSLTVTSKGIVTPSITDGASVLLPSRTGRDIPIDLSPTGAGRDTLQLVYTSNAGEQAAYMLAIEVFEPIFGVPKSTGKPATLVVTSLTTVGRGFRPGDQVGVFDANTLVGLGVVTKTGENLPITMWEGDTGVGLPGFTRGNPIDLRIAKEARGYEGRQVLRPRTVSFSGGSTFGESAIQSVAVAVNEPPFFFSRLSDVGIDRNAFTSKIWARLDTLVVDVDGGSLTYEVETSNDGFQLSVVGTRLVATLEPDFSGKVDIYLTVREGPYVLSDTAVVRIANP